MWLNLIRSPKTSNASDLWCFLGVRKSSCDVSSRLVRKLSRRNCTTHLICREFRSVSVFGSTECSPSQATVLVLDEFKIQKLIGNYITALGDWLVYGRQIKNRIYTWRWICRLEIKIFCWKRHPHVYVFAAQANWTLDFEWRVQEEWFRV